MGEAIETVLFDLGNVIVDFDFNLSARRISNFCDKTHKEIYDLFFNSEITTIFQAGKLSPPDFFNQIKEILDLRLSYTAFVPIWNDIFFLSAKNRAVYNLANNLSSRYKVALISNIDILHYEYLKKRFPVFGIFCKLFLSYELGSVKPDHLIYQRALKDLNTTAEKTFYTDDRKELIQSAQEQGIKAFVFEGIEGLRLNLLNAGVILN